SPIELSRESLGSRKIIILNAKNEVLIVKKLFVFMVFSLLLSSFVFAQNNNQLDPKPYTPGVDSDIDMFMHNWKKSMPRHSHGSLIERDVLTKGDPLNPPGQGAVLTYLDSYSHATLESGAATTPLTLEGKQEVYYFISGRGTIEAGNITAELYKGIGVLVPPNLEFKISNTGDEPLVMYLVSEPVPDDFRVNKEIIVRDENTLPFVSSTVHWCMIFKQMFNSSHGLYHIQSIIVVTFAPLTMGQPHSHGRGTEETWLALDDNTHLLFGKQLRHQPPGTAFMIPVDGKTPHATINTSDKPVKLYHVARYGDHKVRK
ncbi:cupin domain-containing protein, partial [Candidatus Latescibacterota bacterium]